MVQLAQAPRVIIVRRAHDGALARALDSGFHPADLPDTAPPAALDSLLQEPLVAAVIDPAAARAFAVARRLQQAAPLAQIVFVTAAGEHDQLLHATRVSPLIGAHWVVLRRDEPRFVEQLRQQVHVGERRARHRTALNRVNAQLQAQVRPALDPQILRRLVLSQRYLAAIVEHSPDPILTLSPAGEILSWNSSAEQFWGWEAAAAIGRNLGEFLAPAARGVFDESLATIARTRRHLRREFAGLTLAGATVPVEMTLAPVLDEHEQLVAFSIVARDITDRRRAEQMEREQRANLERVVAERTAQLRELVAQLEQFSYTVSHDLRAPLRAIQGYAEILRDEALPATPDARAYFDRIIRAADRMDALVHDVLSYSRVATSQLVLEPVATEPLVRDVIQQLPETVRARADLTIASPLPAVTAHPGLLGQALANLIGNALKFVPPGERPRVRIASETRDGRVRLWVEDNGIGIPPEAQPRIWGIFERLEPSNKFEGTGIGLAIVRKAVERMGGATGVESDGRRGSRFWIELPAA